MLSAIKSLSLRRKHRLIENEAIEWLARLSAGEQNEATEKDFTLWLGQSAIHQAAYIKAEAVWAAGGAMQHSVTGRVDGRASSVYGQSWSKFTISGYAFALLVVLVFGLFISRDYGTSKPSYSYTTAIGEQRDISLSDGTKIFLNTNSHLSTRFEPDKRLIILVKGEAYFDVAHNADRPFYISTGNGVIRVVGTRFSVYRDGSNTEVTVAKGVVAIRSMKDTPIDFERMPRLSDFDMTLGENQHITLARIDKGLKPIAVDAKEQLSWRSSKLVYKSAPLATVVGDMNRYLSRKIIIADNVDIQQEVTAVLRIEHANSAAEVLAGSIGLDLEYDSSANALILSQRKKEQ